MFGLLGTDSAAKAADEEARTIPTVIHDKRCLTTSPGTALSGGEQLCCFLFQVAGPCPPDGLQLFSRDDRNNGVSRSIDLTQAGRNVGPRAVLHRKAASVNVFP